MRIACNIYKYYMVTQSYKHVTLASSYAHIPTVPTQKRTFSVAALDSSALVTSCYLCRELTVIESTVMEEKTEIVDRKKKKRKRIW